MPCPARPEPLAGAVGGYDGGVSSTLGYRLGCPVFGARSWAGEVLPAGTAPRDQLAEYARIFSAVEGNGTFYGLPSPAVVHRWVEDTPESFRFAFKVPRALTHERGLVGGAAILDQFVALLAPLGPRLGPVMVQLSPAAGASWLGRLERFLAALPKEWPRAVEVRHPDWFDEGRNERDLHRLLSRTGAERVCLDSRGLFKEAPRDPLTEAAQARKPRVPPRFVGLGSSPLVRLIGRNDPEACEQIFDEWAAVVARWIREGRSPLVFCHAPDERYAPALARRFHERLRRELPELPELPAWPLPPRPPAGQLGLL